MKDYVKMIIFILILGLVTSVLLGGMDALTKDRIAENQEAELKATLLRAYDIDYTFTNIHNVYDNSVEEVENNDFTFYVDKTTGKISYVFEGNGVWGPIIGVITLESDFETISSITIIQQEETPGLGAVVAERQYLENFVGKKMTPEIVITKNPTNPENEVRAISGATRTSNAFANILNTNYATAKEAWDTRG